MPLLLHIDTATEHASVCISRGEEIIGLAESTEQKNHASFVQLAIQTLMEQQQVPLSETAAVSVSSGPGSYTGLRVGLATAKGICYALNKPMIMVNTLEVMAEAVRMQLRAGSLSIPSEALVCPMIDARRMEVFTALYDQDLLQIQPPHALVLKEESFSEVLAKRPVVFSGSGHYKFKALMHQPHAIFTDVQHNASHLAVLALKNYHNKQFADLAYSEPLYVKEFFDPSRKY